jgi:hypothetical protein
MHHWPVQGLEGVGKTSSVGARGQKEFINIASQWVRRQDDFGKVVGVIGNDDFAKVAFVSFLCMVGWVERERRARNTLRRPKGVKGGIRTLSASPISIALSAREAEAEAFQISQSADPSPITPISAIAEKLSRMGLTQLPGPAAWWQEGMATSASGSSKPPSICVKWHGPCTSGSPPRVFARCGGSTRF